MICPVCHGKRVRYNHDTQTWGPDPCIACGGSGEGPVGNQQSPETRDKARTPRPRRMLVRSSRAWTPAEIRYLRREMAKPRPHGKRQEWLRKLAARLSSISGNERSVFAITREMTILGHAEGTE